MPKSSVSKKKGKNNRATRKNLREKFYLLSSRRVKSISKAKNQPLPDRSSRIIEPAKKKVEWKIVMRTGPDRSESRSLWASSVSRSLGVRSFIIESAIYDVNNLGKTPEICSGTEEEMWKLYDNLFFSKKSSFKVEKK